MVLVKPLNNAGIYVNLLAAPEGCVFYLKLVIDFQTYIKDNTACEIRWKLQGLKIN